MQRLLLHRPRQRAAMPAAQPLRNRLQRPLLVVVVAVAVAAAALVVVVLPAAPACCVHLCSSSIAASIGPPTLPCWRAAEQSQLQVVLTAVAAAAASPRAANAACLTSLLHSPLPLLSRLHAVAAAGVLL